MYWQLRKKKSSLSIFRLLYDHKGIHKRIPFIFRYIFFRFDDCDVIMTITKMIEIKQHTKQTY